MIGNWLYHLFGLGNLSGPWYGFWSGAGSDIGELAIVGALAASVRHHNCHVRGCWRIGRHPVEGTPYVVCRKHHPDGAPTHAHLLALHRAHKDRQAATAPLSPSRKLIRPGGGGGGGEHGDGTTVKVTPTPPSTRKLRRPGGERM